MNLPWPCLAPARSCALNSLFAPLLTLTRPVRSRKLRVPALSYHSCSKFCSDYIDSPWRCSLGAVKCDAQAFDGADALSCLAKEEHRKAIITSKCFRVIRRAAVSHLRKESPRHRGQIKGRRCELVSMSVADVFHLPSKESSRHPFPLRSPS